MSQITLFERAQSLPEAQGLGESKVQVILENKPVPEQVKQIRDVVVCGQKALSVLETGDLNEVRQIYLEGQQ